MDLSATRRRLMMPDPNDPLDPANIDKMLEQRRKSRIAKSSDDETSSRPQSRASSKASGTGEDWLAMAARAAQMSQVNLIQKTFRKIYGSPNFRHFRHERKIFKIAWAQNFSWNQLDRYKTIKVSYDLGFLFERILTRPNNFAGKWIYLQFSRFLARDAIA